MLRVGNAGVTKGVSIKRIGALVALIWITISGHGDAMAGWRIDSHRYLQSYHGENACTDCHSDIDESVRHPEPGNVTKKMEDFFDADKCLECHDDVQGQIEDDAEHGGEEVEDAVAFLNCIECHDPHYEGLEDEDAAGVEMSEDNELCMTCHQEIQDQDPDVVAKNREFCFVCHATGKGMPAGVPVMDPVQLAQSPHAELDCLVCHPLSVQYEHDKQTVTDCAQCHKPHEESVAHEAHAGVSCQACHLGHVAPVRNGKTNELVWERAALPGTVSTLHNLTKTDGEGCARCHFDGNKIGAAAMILPPKSVLCMPCHTATFSAGDTTTVASLAVFALGMLGYISLWFSGSFAGSAGS